MVMNLRKITRAMTLALFLGAASNANAQSAAVVEGIRLTQQGDKLFESRDYAGALASYEKAFELSKNFRLQGLIGDTKFAIGDYLGAIRAYDFYVDSGGENRQKAIDARKRAQSLLASIAIRANVDDYDLLLDGKIVIARGGAIEVNPGSHEVHIQKTGYVSQQKTFLLEKGDKGTATFELQKVDAPVAAPFVGITPIPSQPGVVEQRSRGPVWIGWAATGAVGATTAIFGVLAVKAAGDLSTAKGAPQSSAAELDRLSSRSKSLALATDVLMAATLVSAGISLYFTLRPMKSTTTVGIGPGGFSLAGSFR